MKEHQDPREVLVEAFGGGGEIALASAPGRVNLIGEHIDYHGLAVLPIAIGRRIQVAWRTGRGKRIRAVSGGYGTREFEWTAALQPAAAGDWSNYLMAAAQAVAGKWGVLGGVDLAIVSDLPPAAGLSSSSALIVAVTLALLRAAGVEPGFEELMEVLPEGEHFVGTRGGGMDHAASLASRAGCASLIGFEPVTVQPIPIPEGWRFLVAHSLVPAEKSGAVRKQYNSRRRAGVAALKRLGLASYRDADGIAAPAELSAEERDSFEHVTGEAARVREAVAAMERSDARAFGRLLVESHNSLRDRLQVSVPALDRLVQAALDCGAAGARLTGAGFGGCAVIFTSSEDHGAIRRGLRDGYYAGQPGFDESVHLMDAWPAAGALWRES
jgi:galactokinase